MHRIVLSMVMSSDDSLRATIAGLDGMAGVVVTDTSSGVEDSVAIVISTADPDDVDIVREVVWEIDPCAVQESVVVASLEGADGDLLAG